MSKWNLQTIVCVSFLLLTAPLAGASKPDSKADGADSLVRLPGHVLPALAQAKAVAPQSKTMADEPLTLTVVLKRADQAGFDGYLHDVYDSSSSNYRHFLTQREITARFGPTQEAYEVVLAYLQENGFTLVQGSANRLTLTVSGTRAQAEQAFAVRIADYAAGGRTFTANDQPPAVPARLASYVQSIAGLSNLAAPTRPLSTSDSLDVLTRAAPNVQWTRDVCLFAAGAGGKFGIGNDLISGIIKAFLGNVIQLARLTWIPAFICEGMVAAASASLITCDIMGLFDPTIWQRNPQCREFAPFVFPPMVATRSQAAPGTNAQKIGLLEFDTFKRGDVADWLAAFGGEAALGKLSEVPVNGGVARPGPNESEVLLDIDTVMLFASLPDISYVVYHAPPGTSFQAMFNAMIDDGVTVISNSWSQCENQTTLAEAQSIDSVLQQAAALGISVFNASGDTGSTCLNGSPNTIGVPADSPNATAVGGSSPFPGPGLTYGTEKWWDGTGDTPPTGQGGFGISRYFPRPAYQDGLTSSTMRSVPDVATDADPAQGLQICQASAEVARAAVSSAARV
jgi:subtilase family serine protease